MHVHVHVHLHLQNLVFYLHWKIQMVIKLRRLAITAPEEIRKLENTLRSYTLYLWDADAHLK